MGRPVDSAQTVVSHRVVPHGLPCSNLYSGGLKSSLPLHRRRTNHAGEEVHCWQMDLPRARDVGLVLFAGGCTSAGKAKEVGVSQTKDAGQVITAMDSLATGIVSLNSEFSANRKCLAGL